MRRLRRLDQAVFALFLPLWAVCFGLSGRDALRHTGYRSVVVSVPAGDQDYPSLVGFVPFAGGEASGLRPGDRLLRMGETDLRGVGPVGMAVRFAEESGRDRRVRVVYERAGVRGDTLLAVGSHAIFWPRLFASLVFAVTAALLLLRARPSPMVRAFVQTYMCVALLFACTFTGSPPLTYASIAVHVFSLGLAAPLAVRGALLFPHGTLPTALWARAGPWCFAALGPLDASRFYAFPLSRAVGVVGMGAGAVAYFAMLLVVMTRSYRRADPIGRRQLKWFLFGLYCAFVPLMIAAVLAAFDPRLTPLLVVSLSALALIPVFLLISIVRYNLFDIDRLITSAASYTVLGVVLLASLLAAVPRLAHALAGPTGVEPLTAQLALSLVSAGILVPAHRRLRPQIERVFFAERYALEQAFGRLFAELSACRSPQEVTRLAGERLDALLRPESCAIYARAGDVYAPVFVRGRAIPPAFQADSPLIAALEARAAPLAAEGFLRRRGAAAASPYDRAALETLAVPLVVPVRRGEVLVAFVCLGPKRSGDVYTSTDLAVLTALADKVSSELLSFDQAQIIREGRAMQEALRRYVPGALAEQLARGADLDLGEREVSVLFVDIRGYTSYSEGRAAAEIFSTVNRYAETVSEIVRGHGGMIVQFAGDGLMAVFGAPQALANKERAAVEAGRAMVAAVSSLAVDDAGTQPPLSVGVGIATGKAFVGNVRAVDQLIWAAIGNTTNLAARLQALSRDLEAAIVIDAPTWDRAGPARLLFARRENVPIRGRTQSEDVYVLPLAELPTQTGEPARPSA